MTDEWKHLSTIDLPPEKVKVSCTLKVDGKTIEFEAEVDKKDVGVLMGRHPESIREQAVNGKRCWWCDNFSVPDDGQGWGASGLCHAETPPILVYDSMSGNLADDVKEARCHCCLIVKQWYWCDRFKAKEEEGC